MSAADFGEGSFDKGVFFTVPFDAFLLKSSSGNASFSWRPLTRDGGAFPSKTVALWVGKVSRDNPTLDSEKLLFEQIS